MCQRCAAVREKMREVAKAGPLAGAANIVVQDAIDLMVGMQMIVLQGIPESMTEGLKPYEGAKAIADVVSAGLEFELDPANGHLQHEAVQPPGQANPAPFNQDKPVPSPEEQKLLDEGNDILRDMLGEEGGQ